MNIRLFVCLAILFLFSSFSYSNDSLLISKKRKIFIGTSTAVAYSGSLVYLNQIWYKPYHTSRFHFFNDNAEWAKMDKCGHIFTAWHTTHYLNQLYSYAGYKHSQSISTLIAWTYLLNIEIMDGFSSGWGFSWGDFTANTIGTLAYWLQNNYVPDLFSLKFSFISSPYAQYNPSLLGKSFYEQIIKDYNGQIYWLNISPFYHWKQNMEWLCLSFGYGIDGFIGAKTNIYYRNNQYYDYSSISRQQQFYLSIDIDLSKLKTHKKWLHQVLKSINWIKIPAPALEWKGNNLYFRPLLFSN